MRHSRSVVLATPGSTRFPEVNGDLAGLNPGFPRKVLKGLLIRCAAAMVNKSFHSYRERPVDNRDGRLAAPRRVRRVRARRLVPRAVRASVPGRVPARRSAAPRSERRPKGASGSRQRDPPPAGVGRARTSRRGNRSRPRAAPERGRRRPYIRPGVEAMRRGPPGRRGRTRRSPGETGSWARSRGGISRDDEPRPAKPRQLFRTGCRGARPPAARRRYRQAPRRQRRGRRLPARRGGPLPGGARRRARRDPRRLRRRPRRPALRVAPGLPAGRDHPLALRLRGALRLPARPALHGGAALHRRGRGLRPRHAGAGIRHRPPVPAPLQADALGRERGRGHPLRAVGPSPEGRPFHPFGRRMRAAGQGRHDGPHGAARSPLCPGRRGPLRRPRDAVRPRRPGEDGA